MKSGKIIYYWDLVNIIITPLIYDMFTDSFSYHLVHTIWNEFFYPIHVSYENLNSNPTKTDDVINPFNIFSSKNWKS